MGAGKTKVKMEERSSTSAVDVLPIEVLRLIFSYLPSRDLVVNCSRVCQQWRELVNDDVFWRRRCDAAGVTYPTSTSDHANSKLFEYRFYQRIYIYRPFCRNLVKNWNAAG